MGELLNVSLRNSSRPAECDIFAIVGLLPAGGLIEIEVGGDG